MKTRRRLERPLISYILLTVLVAVSAVGCSSHRVLQWPDDHLDMAEIAEVPLKTYNLKAIRQHYGIPDVIDYNRNLVIYISKYNFEVRLPEPFGIFSPPPGDDKVEYWYLVLHTDSSMGEFIEGEIFYEHYSPPEEEESNDFLRFLQDILWPPLPREEYSEIAVHCRKITQGEKPADEFLFGQLP